MKDYNNPSWVSMYGNLTRGVGISSHVPGWNSNPEGEISLSFTDWLMMDYFSPTFSDF